MSLSISAALLAQIWEHGEQAFPEEGAGLMLGAIVGDDRHVTELLRLDNAFQSDSRDRRYLIAPRDLLKAEEEAESLGLEIVGVFHSHPDHTARASSFDTLWALPVYSYLITQVQAGKAVESRSWRLTEDRSMMLEEPIRITHASTAEEAS
jgi:proteasome lid subunit RPN8/RPN11